MDWRTVRLADTYRFYRVSSDGPTVVTDQLGDSHVLAVDLATGQTRTIAEADVGYQPWTAVVRGRAVAWVEWRYDHLGPTGGIGACHWRVLLTDLDRGETRQLASGVNSRLQGDGAPPPPLAFDGSRLAYAVQQTAASRPYGWQILVVDPVSGRTVRTVATDREIYSLGLSDGTVAYSEGLVDSTLGFVYHTDLIVAEVGSPRRLIATDSFELSFRDGLLSWVADVAGSQGRSGLERSPRVWAAEPPGWRPVAVSSALAMGQRQQWPASGMGAVIYGQSDQSDADRGIPRLWVWDATTRDAHLLPNTLGGVLSDVGGGWLTWAGGLGDAVTVSGSPLNEITATIGVPAVPSGP